MCRNRHLICVWLTKAPNSAGWLGNYEEVWELVSPNYKQYLQADAAIGVRKYMLRLRLGARRCRPRSLLLLPRLDHTQLKPPGVARLPQASLVNRTRRTVRDFSLRRQSTFGIALVL